jgi:type I restriction enzyme S subunit
MKEWKEYKATDFCTNVTDGTHDSPKPKAEGHYLITSKHLQNNVIDFSSAYRISEEDYVKVIQRSRVEQFDILFSMIGTIGNTVRVVSPEVDFAVKNMAIFKMGQNDLKSKWLYYWLKSSTAKAYISSRLAGSTQSYLTLDALRNFPIYAPDERAMQGITDILSSIDDKIELNNRINHNLEEQAQALYKSWFVDFEPFKDGKFVDSEQGMIPEGWQVKNLLEVASLYDSKRKPLSGNERSQMKKIYPYYGATSVMDYVDDFIFDGTYLLMGEDGSVMTEEGFPFLQYVTGKFWPNNHAHVMQGCNGFSTEMLHCALLRKVIKSSVTGAVQAKISQANMKKIQFTCPSRDILVAFDNLLQKIYSQIRIITSQNLVLSLVRDNMLPRLISGKLDF